MISFSWDSRKNDANKKKHGISFDEAKTVFYDESAIRYFDPDHSIDEDRFIMIGLSQKLRILVVCHCFREEDSDIRIISARKATKGEEDNYWRERIWEKNTISVNPNLTPIQESLSARWRYASTKMPLNTSRPWQLTWECPIRASSTAICESVLVPTSDPQ